MMGRRNWLASLAIVAALGGAASVADAQARKAAPAAKAAPSDWTRVVSITPEGGFRMGNPNAAVKVVEYGSLTCPHCAEFSEAAKAPLAAQVRTGKMSFEFRNLVLNGVDLTAALLARCAGPANFFRLTDSLFASQKQWTGKIGAMTQAQRDQMQALPDNQKFGRLAAIAGLMPLAAQAGVPAQKASACLADKSGVDRLLQMAQAAQALGVNGTPTFFVNGAKVHAHDWAELLPSIRNAGG
jgi:protein-disulfide isomerase